MQAFHGHPGKLSTSPVMQVTMSSSHRFLPTLKKDDFRCEYKEVRSRGVCM